MKVKTFVYTDPVNDDFAGNNIKTEKVPADYKYSYSAPFSVFAFILYYFIAMPITKLYIRAAYHHRFVNKRKLKETKNSGCFFFGNHTLFAGDAFIPNHMYIRKNYTVVGPDAVSIKGLKSIVKALGGVPLPSTIKCSKNYLSFISSEIKKGKTVTIYPEAHIWPYYTGIRPFKDGSFALPVMFDAPVYSFTNVYFKSRSPLRKRPVIKTYINGPFYPDLTLDKRERIKDLRDRVYDSMVYEAEKQKQYVTNIYIKEDKKSEQL